MLLLVSNGHGDTRALGVKDKYTNSHGWHSGVQRGSANGGALQVNGDSETDCM